MQTILGDVAETAARTNGLIRRPKRVKLTGAQFVQTLVFGFMADPHATREALAQTAAALDVDISPQAIDQRLTEPAAHCLEDVLAAATVRMIAADPVAVPLLQRFAGVLIQDTTTIGLPETVAMVWRGSGNGATPAERSAALKLAVRLNVTTGALEGPTLEHGCTSDRHTALEDHAVPAGALRIADLGFFALDELVRVSTAGGYWLTRLQVNTGVYVAGQRTDLLTLLATSDQAEVDLAVALGVAQRLPARLLAVRVPQEVADQRRRRVRADAKRHGRTVSPTTLALAGWTILVTNAPVALLSGPEARVLARVRWQIELLFKLWKSHGQIDAWRSQKPWAILCELYAKLIGLIVLHWIVLVSCWAYPDRSLLKAAQTVRAHACCLISALKRCGRLEEALLDLAFCLQVGCRINKSQKTPHTFQLLLDVLEANLG
jgi:hypothetical protein